jgi:hypothetical protein
MRKQAVVKGFKNSQKIRVILNGVGIYMRVGDIENTFATSTHYTVVSHTLELMHRDTCSGIGHTMTVYDHKMNRERIAVQVDLL